MRSGQIASLVPYDSARKADRIDQKLIRFTDSCSHGDSDGRRMAPIPLIAFSKGGRPPR